MTEANSSDRVTVATLDGAPLRADFPLHTVVFGLDAVVIPLSEYKRLLASTVGRSFDEPLKSLRTARQPRPRKITPSTIERDPEVATFASERLRRGATLRSVRDACVDAFGEERAPSSSALHRFRRHL